MNENQDIHSSLQPLRIRSSGSFQSYAKRYRSFRKQAAARILHPNVPWILALIFIVLMGSGLFQIWLRTKPIMIAHQISQELKTYQSLLERKKRLSLELSQHRAGWYSKAKDDLHMIYPTNFTTIKGPFR